MLCDDRNCWDLVRPTYIENWPERLYGLSISQERLGLSYPQLFLSAFEKIMDGKPLAEAENRNLQTIEVFLDNGISRFAHGCFVRLGSRSPKDSFIGYREGFKCTNGHHALSLLLDSPDRIYDDVALAVAHDYQPQIYLREWVEIPEWAEFRCFMKDGLLVGISQYNYLKEERFEEVCENSGSISWAIEKFFTDYLRSVLYPHFDSVVFDVFMRVRGRGNEKEWQVKLLEINPWYHGTDPCLFSWEKPEDFDGAFRYCIAPTPAKPNYDDLLTDLKADLAGDTLPRPD